MREDILRSIYDWNPWLEKNFPKELSGVSRSVHFEPYLQIPEVKIFEGARRTGKSTLLYQVMEKLLREGSSVLYINFEDEIFKKYSLSEIIQTSQIIFSTRNIFLDEVQNCVDWVSFIRSAYDRKIFSQIWISGSNSSFIQKEFASLLTGRNITIKVFPLSFAEYLLFKEVPIRWASSKNEVLIKKHFLEHLEVGGFPAVVLRHVLQKELLLSYFEDFIYKDIASRYEVSPHKIKELGIYLATNSGKTFSYRGCATALSLHPQTVMSYCSYFYEIFLFNELYKFDYSLQNQIGSDKKIYICDVGLARAVSFRFSEDIGRVLETLVHNELKRRHKEIYFHKQQYECDFLIKEELKITEAIQVTKTLSDSETKKRELRGIVEALEIHKIEQGLILTLDEEGFEEIQIGQKTVSITILPIWKWLLKDLS